MVNNSFVRKLTIICSFVVLFSGCRLLEPRPPTNDQRLTAVPGPTLTEQPPTTNTEPATTDVGPEPGSPSPTPSPVPSLATPYAQEPAAGICGAVEGERAPVEIFPDIPSPRCLQVTETQYLQVANQTDQRIKLRLGPYEVLLEAGEITVLDAPLGDFLAPGVHVLESTPFSGPELWLVE